MFNKESIRNLIILSFTIIGIFLLFLTGILFRTSLFAIIGLSLIFFILLYVFIYWETFKSLNYKKEFISENLIKLIALVLILVLIFVPVESADNSIELWENISILTIFRALVLFFCFSFLPGSNIYSIFFSNNGKALHKHLNIKIYILKITFYPLFSFSFIGLIVLFLDQLNLSANFIIFLLLLVILFLSCLDFLFQIIRRKKNQKDIINKSKIEINQNYLILIILAISIPLISIGIMHRWRYLPSGDGWITISFAKYIGDENNSPLFQNYPNFWSYITFALSKLTGMPFLNILSFFPIFNYLFPFTSFFLMKSILINFKEKYAILATILLLIFSAILANPIIPLLNFNCILNFNYKTFSYICFFLGISLFFNITQQNQTHTWFKLKHIKAIAGLSVFFSIISFITYIFPFLITVIFLVIYAIFSEKSKRVHNINKVLFFLLTTSLAFILLDMLMDFHLTNVIFYYFRVFNIEIFTQMNSPPLIYFLLLFLNLILVILRSLFIFYERIISKRDKMMFNYSLFKILLGIFLSLLFLGIILIIIKRILNFELTYFFLFNIENIYVNLGFIGIVGIILSYYCFKKYKSLYFILTSWIIAIITISFLPILQVWLINNEIPHIGNQFNIASIWFTRMWVYIPIPLSIFASIGIFSLKDRLERLKGNKLKKLFIKNFYPLTFISLILFSYSGLAARTIPYGTYRLSDEELEIIQWSSQNLPINSNVLIIDYFFLRLDIKLSNRISVFSFEDIFSESYNETEYDKKIDDLKYLNVQFAIIYKNYFLNSNNKTNFLNDILIDDFYNQTLFSSGNRDVCYAPYFN